MAESQYAFIKNEIVQNIVLFDSPTEELLNFFKQEKDLDLIIPVNGDNNAIIGSTWDGENFIKPKPYPSWVLDSSKKWIAPIPYPNNDESYYWKEESVSWILIPQYPDDGYPYLWDDEQKEWHRATTYWDDELSSWENIPEKPNESSIWDLETKSWVLL